MIEIKSRIHTMRLYAANTSWLDLFKMVIYYGFRGDIRRVPRWFKFKKGATALSDLTMPEDILLSRMKSNTRNEIRRAEKEGCSCEISEDVDSFIAFYNAFCASKGFPDYTDREKLSRYPNVMLTKAVSRNGEVLAMHANVIDESSECAFLLYSCSQRLDQGVDRKLIGWGNRFLHWKELLLLKKRGIKLYDWSGVDPDPNSETYSIGQFKLAFGGDLTDSYVLSSPLYYWANKFRALIVELKG